MNGMVAQVHSVPDLIRNVVQRYDDEVRTKIDQKLFQSIQRIYLTGCGDSHHVSIGSELAFELLTGLPTEALTSLQFGRYAADTMPQSNLGSNFVVGTSVSGEVSRTLEALLMGKKFGAKTLAMTATPTSHIGRAADLIVDTTQPPFENPPGMYIPGVRSYVANQIGLLLVAIRIGEVRGHIQTSEANDLRKEIEALGNAAEKTIASTDTTTMTLAQEWKDAQEFVFVGGGPNYASALFSAAKVLEATGDSAMGQDTEEWAHLQYYARNVSTPTFFISAGDRDLSRMTEVIVAAQQIGRRVAVVIPASKLPTTGNTYRMLSMAEGVQEMFSTIISIIPGSLFAAYRADVIGEPFFRNLEGGRGLVDGDGISRIRTSEMLSSD